MTDRLSPSRTALLVIDVQQAFAQKEAAGERRNNPGALDAIAALLDAFRRAEAPVVHVRHRNVSPRSRFHPDAAGFQPMEAARERPGETLIVKDVNSAFIGTPLDDHLRASGIEALAIVGITTNHCVETTTRMAGNLGYETLLVSDATYTFDRTGPDGRLFPAEDIQAMTLANLHGEFCTVTTAEQVSKALAAATASGAAG